MSIKRLRYFGKHVNNPSALEGKRGAVTGRAGRMTKALAEESQRDQPRFALMLTKQLPGPGVGGRNVLIKKSSGLLDAVAHGPMSKAASRQREQPGGSGLDDLKMVAGGGTALATLPAAARRLSSRVNLVHGTSSGAAKSILEKGLLPAASTGNHVNTLSDWGREVAEKPLVYLSKSTPEGKAVSRLFAHMSEEAAEARAQGLVQSDMDRLLPQGGPSKGKLLRVSLPYSEAISRRRENPAIQHVSPFDSELRNHLRRAVVLEGGIDTKHIKGSKDYQRQTLKEVVDYARKNPRRFSAGLGLAGLGLAGGALAVQGARSSYLANKES